RSPPPRRGCTRKRRRRWPRTRSTRTTTTRRRKRRSAAGRSSTPRTCRGGGSRGSGDGEMATATAKKLPATTTRETIPPLESGDPLTAAEFERRYDAMQDLKKAELLEGVVYVGSPVSLERHGEPHTDLMVWLGVYKAHTPGVRAADNSTVR